jgi:hypothetical protein
MKKYYVEFKRVAYLEIEVEAETPGEAEDLAWAELDKDPDSLDKDWYVNQIHKEEQ